MGLRGELFTTQVVLENRTYFFNVKENRNGDVFLQVVESKNKNGEEFDRHAIVVFAEDMQQFFKGLDDSIAFVEKDRKQRKKAALEKKAAKQEKYAKGAGSADASGKAPAKKRVYRKKGEDGQIQRDEPTTAATDVKKTGRLRVVSKRET